MYVIIVARKFGTKYHHWAYGPFASLEEAMAAARVGELNDYILVPLLPSISEG